VTDGFNTVRFKHHSSWGGLNSRSLSTQRFFRNPDPLLGKLSAPHHERQCRM